ncbi:MAG: hypothetical protein KTR26_20150 [Flammeovirgaceae bacterium]|nr:hypothetical protein [Flammeovirgaceae bacterium]
MESKIGFRYGILSLIGYILFFGLMKGFNLIEIIEFRFFNLFILTGGIWLAVKHLKDNAYNSSFYYSGFLTGLTATVVGIIGFALFMGVYLHFLDPNFMIFLKNNEPFGQYLNPASIMGVLFIEGLASGLISTFAVMQYYKAKTKSLNA